MPGRQPAVRLVVHPGFKQDLQALHDAALQNPGGQEARLLRVTFNQLDRISKGAHSTHQLEYLPSYPDLSDCETTYVGEDPNRKPSHRLVWREKLPEDPRQPVVREVLALGERNLGQAYYLTGQRLGRPVGFTLGELYSQREPIRTAPSRQRVNHPTLDQPRELADSLELG